MEKIDITIIGGGVIGLAVASEVAAPGRNVFIIEKNRSFGEETSSRNSEVIHSGIYYPEASLKDQTCLEGNELLYRICEAHRIPYARIGKLIVARDSTEIGPLEDLFKRGEKKGLKGLRMLTGKEAGDMEPDIKAVRAVYLPMTGIIDSHRLMKYFLSRANASGADILYNSEVTGIDRTAGGYHITVSGDRNEAYTFTSGIVINCAGLNSDVIAKMAGIQNDEYDLSYCKGDYFRVGNKKNFLVKKLIYPVSQPDDTDLGIHLTPDLGGGSRLGPDAEYLESREIDYSVDPGKRNSFYESVRMFMPFLKEEDLSADTAGIRPKLQKKGETFRDFVIKHEAESGFSGFINLIGIESPGLTASPAIARRVKKIVKGTATIY